MLPLVFLTGLAFAGLGLIMTSLSPSYDFFMYYFTLAVTPMMLASGVFFPIEQLPSWLRAAALALPLTHAVALGRPLMNGIVPDAIGLHVLVLVGLRGRKLLHRARARAPAPAHVKIFA